MSKPIRVLIADDQATDRAGIESLLSHLPQIVVSGSVPRSSDVIPWLRKNLADVLLVDLMWYGNIGVGNKLIREIREQNIRIKIIALSNYTNLLEEAIKSGADEARLKSYSRDELVQLIHSVCRAGERPLLEDNLQAASLTEREYQVLRLISDGLTDREIGQKLHISSNTVKRHVSSLMGKLGSASRAQAVKIALTRGILPAS